MNFTAILIGFLLTVHVIVCILLVLIILMQRPRSEGLGTAFGTGRPCGNRSGFRANASASTRARCSRLASARP